MLWHMYGVEAEGRIELPHVGLQTKASTLLLGLTGIAECDT